MPPSPWPNHPVLGRRGIAALANGIGGRISLAIIQLETNDLLQEAHIAGEQTLPPVPRHQPDRRKPLVSVVIALNVPTKLDSPEGPVPCRRHTCATQGRHPTMMAWWGLPSATQPYLVKAACCRRLRGHGLAAAQPARQLRTQRLAHGLTGHQVSVDLQRGAHAAAVAVAAGESSSACNPACNASPM